VHYEVALLGREQTQAFEELMSVSGCSFLDQSVSIAFPTAAEIVQLAFIPVSVSLIVGGIDHSLTGAGSDEQLLSWNKAFTKRDLLWASDTQSLPYMIICTNCDASISEVRSGIEPGEAAASVSWVIQRM